jgi:hypothetical protein
MAHLVGLASLQLTIGRHIEPRKSGMQHLMREGVRFGTIPKARHGASIARSAQIGDALAAAPSPSAQASTVNT